MRDFRAFLLDLDGVVYRGNQALRGAGEFVSWADATGRQALYLSNNSFATVEDVTAKLERLGLPRPRGRVMTAGEAAVHAVAERFPGGSVFVLAVPAIERMAEAAGLHTVWRDTEDAAVPDAVLVGLDRTLTYERLRRAHRALQKGAEFFAVNRDPRLPVEDGFEPGTGAIVAAVEYASGISPHVIGKPEPEIVRQAMRHLGVSAAETLMIGDGLDLDIVAGHAAGVRTALVLTGLTSRQEAADAQGERRPDYVFDDLAALLSSLRR